MVGRLAQKEERETALYTKGERVHKTIKENNAKKTEYAKYKKQKYETRNRHKKNIK